MWPIIAMTMGGCETNLERAMESFTSLKVLMDDLGLEESGKKAEAPARQMVYLGVMFDSSAMEMRVPPDKLTEIKSEIGQWSKKTTITRKNLCWVNFSGSAVWSVLPGSSWVGSSSSSGTCPAWVTT